MEKTILFVVLPCLCLFIIGHIIFVKTFDIKVHNFVPVPVDVKDRSSDENVKHIRDNILTLQSKMDPRIANIIAIEINEASKYYQLDSNLITAICFKESSFNHMVETKSRHIGLMQIHYDSWKDYLNIQDYKSLFLIDNNIGYGCMILNYYKEKCNDNWIDVLNEYSGGKPGYAEQVLTLANSLGM